MKRNWTTPTIVSLNNNTIKSGATGPFAFEAYVNLGSGSTWPCALAPPNAAGCVSFTTNSFYFTTAGIAPAGVAACNQAGGVTAITVCS